MKEAIYYKKRSNKRVHCFLCPQNCLIANGKRGICKARINQEGKLYSENYSKVSAIAIDPIEKKPLYHFYPGTKIISIGSFGCNLSCSYCQNWQISQRKPHLEDISTDKLILLAKEGKSNGIAYTYSEPSICFEYLAEAFPKAHRNNLKNIMVSNGYLNKEALFDLIPYLDAVNIDLKAFNNDFYNDICNGSIKAVINNIRYLYESNIHIEITTLIIPDTNDSLAELEKLFIFLSSLSKDIPLHLSRYFPNYKMKKAATSIKVMKDAFHLAKKYLNYVYLGNVDIADSRSSICPQCGELIINRKGYYIEDYTNKGQCRACTYQLAGKF
ncbi:AmmeMemoRadiSam system radical SAM enzyme [Natronospora cellulosivora (SeqCode)]